MSRLCSAVSWSPGNYVEQRMSAYGDNWNYELNINSIMPIVRAVMRTSLYMTPESEFHGEGRVLGFGFGRMDISSSEKRRQNRENVAIFEFLQYLEKNTICFSFSCLLLEPVW